MNLHGNKSLLLYRPKLSYFAFVALIFFIHDCQIHALANKPLLRRIRSIIPQKFPLSLPWYEDGLEFSCTGCGKCCKVDGDVWLAPEEVTNIIQHLKEKEELSTIEDFRKKYVRAEIAPANGDSSESWMCLKRKEGACVFLDHSGQCGIYDSRPVQCYTYPFWPSLLEDSDVWSEESVLPDAVPIREGTNDKHWSPEFGGCEGIGRVIDAVAEVDEHDLENVDLKKMLDEQQEFAIVDRKEIIEKRKEAKRHWKRFPGEEIKRTTWYL